MQFSVLSSGSKANSTYFEADGVRILIDCGLSARETERRLASLAVHPESLDAILITHEHSDHIMGVSVLSRRFNIPVFANKATARVLNKVYAIETFRTGENFSVKTLNIDPFSIVHDASDPVGFVIRSEGLKFVQVTDLGRVTPLVRHALNSAHAVVLESNHDQEMLRTCDYSWELKQRIASSHGHLSNDCAGALLREISHNDLCHVVLAHLSENSNRPDLALQTVRSYFKESCKFLLQAACVASSTAKLRVGEESVQVAV